MKEIPKHFRKLYEKIIDRLGDLNLYPNDQSYIDNEKSQIKTLAHKLLEEPDALKWIEALSVDSDSLTLEAAGDIIFRDKNQHFHITIQVDSALSPPQASIIKYQENLRKRLNRLPLLESVERKAGADQQTRLELEDVFVSLKTHVADNNDLDKKSRRLEQSEQQSILLSEAVGKYHRAAVIGKPGSGKTTFVNRLMISLLDGKPMPGWPDEAADLVPLHLLLREFADWLEKQRQNQKKPTICAGLVWDYLDERLHEKTEDSVLPWLKTLADQGNLLVVMDGLDEVPYELTDDIKRAILDFIEHNGNNRFLVTCRALSWADEVRGKTPWQLQGDWPLLLIHDLDNVQIEDFIGIWYGNLADRWGITKSEKNSLVSTFKTALQRESLAEIQKVPLLLTVMALVHSERESLPDKLAVLYKKAVDILVDRWDTLSEADKDHRLQRLLRQASCEREDLLARLAEVAWNAHGSDLSSRLPANISLSQLNKAVSSIGPADADSYTIWEKNVVQGMRLRAGLLLPVGGKADFFQFPHKSFEEYMAGLHLASLSDSADPDGVDTFSDTLFRIAGESIHWRYVIQFAAGILGSESTTIHKAIDLLRVLCVENPDKDADWCRSWMAGVALVEIDAKRVMRKDPALYTRIHQSLMELIQRGGLGWRERLEVAELLNSPGLQDSRPGIQIPHWESIGGGSFVMGSAENDDEAYDDEYHQPRQINMPHSYLMTRYPVTVVQYALFLESDSEQQRPEEWIDQLTHPNQPVTGVTWKNATAWCAWATQQLPQWAQQSQADLLVGFLKNGECVVRLPTEAEWENAARGSDARRYPWGNNDWDSEKALLKNKEIKWPAAVGLFPEGVTKGQAWTLFDMTGNVFEWTLSKWQAYPYSNDKGVIDPGRNDLTDSRDRRVVRGGAFSAAIRGTGVVRIGTTSFRTTGSEA